MIIGRDVDLQRYWTPVMQEYRELLKVAHAENPEFKYLWEANTRIRNDLFVQTAEEAGLRRYEKMLGITLVIGDSYELRRARIMSKWFSDEAYTMKYLMGILTAMLGDEFELECDFDKLTMYLVLLIDDDELLAEITRAVLEIVPAPTIFMAKKNTYVEASGDALIRAAMIEATIYKLQSEEI
jgi:hypothetical protein